MSNTNTKPLLDIIKHAVSEPDNLSEANALKFEQVFDDVVKDVGLARRKLVLRISQTSTGAPTIGATVENSLNNTPTPVFARTGTGVYTLSGVTTTALKNKTVIMVTNGSGAAGFVTAAVDGSDHILISTFNTSFAAADGILTDCQLVIDIYN